MSDKKLFKAIMLMSEVLNSLVEVEYNYSEKLAKKMSKTLTAVNDLLPIEKITLDSVIKKKGAFKEITTDKGNPDERHCLRCGYSEKEIRKYRDKCYIYGTSYSKHLYDKKGGK